MRMSSRRSPTRYVPSKAADSTALAMCASTLSLSDTPLAVLCAAAVDSQTYFASPCKFGPGGVKEVLGFGELSSYEKGWFDKMMPELKAQIKKGIEFANA